MSENNPETIGQLLQLKNNQKTETNRFFKLGLRLIVFLAILAFVPESTFKFVAFSLFALIAFHPLSRIEFILFIFVNIIYFIMDAAAIHNQFFAFEFTQILGMPYYEMLVWGIYYLIALRSVSNHPIPKSHRYFFLSFICFLMAFNASPTPELRSIFCLIILIISLIFSFNKQSLMVIILFLVMGLSVEQTGIYKGFWYYPNEVTNYIPIWSYLVWVASGFYLVHFVAFLNYVIYSKGVPYELSTTKTK